MAGRRNPAASPRQVALPHWRAPDHVGHRESRWPRPGCQTRLVQATFPSSHTSRDRIGKVGFLGPRPVDNRGRGTWEALFRLRLDAARSILDHSTPGLMAFPGSVRVTPRPRGVTDGGRMGTLAPGDVVGTRERPGPGWFSDAGRGSSPAIPGEVDRSRPHTGVCSAASALRPEAHAAHRRRCCRSSTSARPARARIYASTPGRSRAAGSVEVRKRLRNALAADADAPPGTRRRAKRNRGRRAVVP